MFLNEIICNRVLFKKIELIKDLSILFSCLKVEFSAFIVIFNSIYNSQITHLKKKEKPARHVGCVTFVS